MNQDILNNITVTDNLGDEITVKQSDGSERKAEKIMEFTMNDNQKKYVIYTFNEVDKNNLNVVYTSEIVSENGNPEAIKFVSVTDDNEWNRIKNIMRAIIKTEE